MNWTRWTAVALGALVIVGPTYSPTTARADEVTGISTLSQANRLSIFHDYRIDALGQTESGLPGSPGGGIATYLLGGWASTDPIGTDRQYSFSFTPIAGYDSNPEASKVAAGGAFVGGDFLADYRLNFGPDDATVGAKTFLYFSYDATGGIYSGNVEFADTFQHTLTGNFRHNLFDDTIVLRWNFNDQFTMEHDAAFLNNFETNPSVEALLTRQTSVQFGFDYTNFQYYFPVNPTKNPDADRNTFQSAFHFYSFPQQRGPVPESPDVLTDILRGSFKSVTVGYDHDWNIASGRDYDYEGSRVYVGFEGIGIHSAPDLSLDVRYAHEWDDYSHPNAEGVLVLAGRPKARKRKDNLDILTFRGNARLFDLSHHRGTVSTFVQWDIIDDHSSIFARHFNEFAVSAGLTYRY